MEIDSQPYNSKAAKKNGETEEDLYLKLKELENQLELLNIQEEYIRDEQRQLKSEYIRSKEEVSSTSWLIFVIRSKESSLSTWEPVHLWR